MQVAALEVAASRLAAMDAQRQSLQSQIEELKAGQAQMHALERSIAALAIVPIALTKMRTRHNDLTAKVGFLTVGCMHEQRWCLVPCVHKPAPC